MQKYTGLTHFFKAAGYSIQGLKAAFKYEAGFRHEVGVSIIMLPLAFILGNTKVEIALLVASVLMVFVVELLNSGIEAIVDRVGTEYHELSGRAKDLGSAAVFMAMVTCGIVWLIILFF
ncbi:diacylglycerol kinase [Pasteurella skyensis]|uniref:Diacylglycerol kinase n=1 Tax=Phocoenobacter skyensis TaxID=97481 RepID=A0AAJ6N9V0_9PAST|nr:diacylglycerol kinase [Pasteurella skyensis]MDP8162562.1 diacylglycerol kinase [Pasteurella skyensis]MDP8172840.1 diacylglycerol kinase [Pasteurella skyensis]MDP8177316.1 diacylglycerol kinase [Pasteurella skyensis]MDP8179243.1 diacylglycerol kinase [Pasteurella skyensis]MDP8183510.1 diacylglycerol kinase [Pasteurella skyensis]